VPTPAGVKRHVTARDAASGCALVLAVTSATAALAVIEDVIDAVGPGAVYADLSTASPDRKRRLAAVAADAGRSFADVALMAPVPGNGVRTPALVAGTGADRFAELLRPRGMPVDVVGDDAGQAATRKLLRSIVMKGLAQLLIEALQAAEVAGVVDETWDNLVAQLSSADEALLRRLVTGTARHAARRVDEMEATVAMLTALGVDPDMTRATVARLRRIAQDPDVVPSPPPSER
jgi:3-hydroxyisobutyrate dehydrogenase